MKEFLESVQKILEERGRQYGNPQESFTRIAKAWSLTLKQEITPVDACIMMIDFKIARLRNDPTNEDSMRDIVGYTCCLWQLTVSARRLKAVRDKIESEVINWPTNAGGLIQEFQEFCSQFENEPDVLEGDGAEEALFTGARILPDPNPGA